MDGTPKDRLLAEMRAVDRMRGYAIGLHGPEARDPDLIGAPWRKECSPPDGERATQRTCRATIGICRMPFRSG
jgi:hypothetical protein